MSHDRPGAVWIVDAETSAYTALAQELAQQGHAVRTFASMEAASEASAAPGVGMPALLLIASEALAACRAPLTCAFMTVAHRDSDEAVRSAFARGAIDHFTAPLGAHEVAFKVGRQLAASSKAAAPEPKPTGRGRSGDLRMDQAVLTVGFGEGASVTLTPREFQILGLLYHSPGHSVTRASVFVSVWSGVKVCQKVLDVHVSKLRKKLKPLAIGINFVRPSNYVLDFPGGSGAGVSSELRDASAQVSA